MSWRGAAWHSRGVGNAIVHARPRLGLGPGHLARIIDTFNIRRLDHRQFLNSIDDSSAYTGMFTSSLNLHGTIR
jgi:hypothetical protein